MEKAFITGLEGFTGRYLARELRAAGYAVSGTELVKSADADPGVFQCDLCDMDALKRVVAEVKPDVVAHLAGIAFVPHGNADAMYRTNLDVVRDFSDVRTLVQVYRRLLQLAPDEIPRGEAFNTCSGKGHSLLSVIQMMQEISGHSIEVRVNPEFVRDNEVKVLLGSRAKLEKIIGTVEDIPLVETLRWMYQGGGAVAA